MFPVPPQLRLRTRINQYLGFAPKDWITFGMSFVALVGSAITGYFTLLREDSLSAVIGSFPFVQRQDADNLAIVGDKTKLIFMNSGNRSAAVTNVSLTFIQHDGPSRCSGLHKGSDVVQFSTNFEPMAVKANEVVTQSIKLLRAFDPMKQQRNEKGSFIIPLSVENRSSEYANVEICYSFDVTTPSIALHRKEVSGVKFRLERNMTSYDPNEQRNVPYVILNERKIKFIDWLWGD